VQLVDGSNVYIQDNQGNVIKVTTGPSAVVTVTKPGTPADLKPGDNVSVQGTTDASGNIAATAINPVTGGFGRGGGGAATGAATPAATGANGTAATGANGTAAANPAATSANPSASTAAAKGTGNGTGGNGNGDGNGGGGQGRTATTTATATTPTTVSNG